LDLLPQIAVFTMIAAPSRLQRATAELGLLHRVIRGLLYAPDPHMLVEARGRQSLAVGGERHTPDFRSRREKLSGAIER